MENASSKTPELASQAQTATAKRPRSDSNQTQTNRMSSCAAGRGGNGGRNLPLPGEPGGPTYNCNYGCLPSLPSTWYLEVLDTSTLCKRLDARLMVDDLPPSRCVHIVQQAAYMRSTGRS